MPACRDGDLDLSSPIARSHARRADLVHRRRLEEVWFDTEDGFLIRVGTHRLVGPTLPTCRTCGCSFRR